MRWERMKTHRRFLCGVVLVAVSLLLSQPTGDAQGLPPDPLVLTEVDDGTTANAVVGQAIEVNLHGNVTTGYVWMLASSDGDAVVTNGPVTYTMDSGGGVGVGGTFSFPFLASTRGDSALGFEYRRSGEATPIQTFAATIHVTVAPRLSIKQVEANVVISWAIEGSTNFFLEGATNVDAPQWAALNVLPLPDGTNYTVTLGAGGSALYFRLHRL